LWALAVIGPDALDALEPVTGLLVDKDVRLRAQAAQTVAEMGPAAREAAPRLAKALRDPDGLVRAWAAYALHEIGPEMAVHVLPVLKDRDPAVRLSAVQALALFCQSKVAVQALADALRDPEVTVRAAAAASLTRLGPAAKTALPGLLQCLKENNSELQSQAFMTIMAIGSPEHASLLDSLSELNTTNRWAWPGKQAAADRKATLTPWLLALDDPNGTRRLGAVLALGQLGPEAKEAASHLAKTLQRDSNRSVLAAALLVVAAWDPQKSEGKTAEMLIAEVWKDLKSTKKLDPEELIQLYLLTSALSHPRFGAGQNDAKLRETVLKARAWAAKAIDDLPSSPWALRALVRGINTSAEFSLGFTEPFSRLSFKFRALVKDEKDIPALGYALLHLGETVPAASPLRGPVEQDWFEVLTNQALLDWMIAARQQLLAAKTLADWQRIQRQLSLAMQKQHQQLTLALLNVAKVKEFPTFRQDVTKLHFIDVVIFDGRLVSARVLSDTHIVTGVLEYNPDAHIGHSGGICPPRVVPGGGGSAAAKPMHPKLAQAQHQHQHQHNSGGSPRNPTSAQDNLSELLLQTQQDLDLLLVLRIRKTVGPTLEQLRKLANESVPALIAKLQDPDPAVRWSAAILVAQKRVHAEKELIQGLSDPVAEVKEAAHQALIRLARGTDFGPKPADSRAKIEQAIQSWNSWLLAQETTSPTLQGATSKSHPNVKNVPVEKN
jgi:HEAT repeat protein